MHWFGWKLSFALGQFNLKWENVLFSTFGTVRSVSVWVAANKLGSSLMEISEAKMNPNRYLEILDEILLPFLNMNRNMIFVQVNRIFFHRFLLTLEMLYCLVVGLFYGSLIRWEIGKRLLCCLWGPMNQFRLEQTNNSSRLPSSLRISDR